MANNEGKKSKPKPPRRDYSNPYPPPAYPYVPPPGLGKKRTKDFFQNK
jgi:hypothetical protein